MWQEYPYFQWKMMASNSWGVHGMLIALSAAFQDNIFSVWFHVIQKANPLDMFTPLGPTQFPRRLLSLASLNRSRRRWSVVATPCGGHISSRTYLWGMDGDCVPRLKVQVDLHAHVLQCSVPPKSTSYWSIYFGSRMRYQNVPAWCVSICLWMYVYVNAYEYLFCREEGIFICVRERLHVCRHTENSVPRL